jgi:twitching motility protein PilT
MISILNQINQTRAEHILTIEDPVEYVFSEDKCIFSQREI